MNKPIISSDKPNSRQRATKWRRLIHELPTLCSLWFSLFALYAITTIATGEFYRFLFVARHPLMLVINSVALLALMIQSGNWFYQVAQTVTVSSLKRSLLIALLVGLLLIFSWIVVQYIYL